MVSLIHRDLDVQLKCVISCRCWNLTFIATVQTNPWHEDTNALIIKAIIVENLKIWFDAYKILTRNYVIVLFGRKKNTSETVV